MPRSVDNKAEILDSSDSMYKWPESSHGIYYHDERKVVLDGHVEFPSGPVRVQRCQSLIENQGRRKLIVRVGDDVQLTWGGKPAYCTIKELLVVWIKSIAYLWLVPGVWYYDVNKGKTHHLRETVIQRRKVPGDERSFAPIPPDDIIQQVAVQHSCEMNGPQKCFLRRICQHGKSCCNQKCKGWVHFPANNRFEIIDRAAGYGSSYVYE